MTDRPTEFSREIALTNLRGKIGRLFLSHPNVRHTRKFALESGSMFNDGPHTTRVSAPFGHSALEHTNRMTCLWLIFVETCELLLISDFHKIWKHVGFRWKAKKSRNWNQGVMA